MIYLVFLAALLPFALILYGRLISPLKLQRRWRFFWGSIIVTLTALVAYALPLTLQMARHPAAYVDSIWMTLLPWMYYAMTLLFVLIMLIVIRDLVWLGAKVVHSVREYRQNAAMKKSGRTELTPEEIEAGNVQMSRRTFLKKASTLAVVGGAVVATPISIYAAKHDRKIKEVEIALEQLSKELDGLRIVQLSDIHVGNTMFKEDVAAIVSETNALNPDLIAITGLVNLDFADVKAVMKDRGNALIGIGVGSGENRAVEAAKQAVASPLLETSINGATDAIINVTGGSSLTLFEVEEAAEVIRTAANTDINTIFGAVINENLNDEVIVTVIATGFEEPSEPLYHSFNSTNREEMYKEEDDYNDNDLDIPPFIRDRQDY